MSNGRAGTVSVVDVGSRREIAQVTDVGARPWGIAVTRDGKKLYVANGPSNDVAIIDADRLVVVARLPAGEMPWGVTIAQ